MEQISTLKYFVDCWAKFDIKSVDIRFGPTVGTKEGKEDECVFQITRDRVMLTKELLEAEVPETDPTYDKLFGSCFIAAAVEESSVGSRKRWGLHLDGAPIVVLKDKLKDELGLHPDTPTVDQMRDLGSVDIGKGLRPYGKYSLVSGGAIVYCDGKILCLKRDRFAPKDPGLLTTPAGRMSEWLSTMSGLELAEEMIIVLRHNATGKLVTLGGFRPSRKQLSENDILVKKMRQISRMSSFFTEMGMDEAKVLGEIKGIDDIIPMNLDQFACQNMLDERADQVFTFDNFKIRDQCSGYVFFDKKNNTLEYREVFDLTLPGFSLYAIMPGEFFLAGQKKVINETQILSQDELMVGIKNSTIGVVPTLRAYISGLEASSVINFFRARA